MNDALASEITPVASGERISSIDLLRGFAVLNLLPLHLNSYTSVLDELAGHAPTGLNRVVAFYAECLSATFFTLFAMLFGAGVILLTGRADASGRKDEIGDIYYRRLLWLLLFGVIHQYVILWSADVLFWYAVCGLFLFPIRKLSPKVLTVVGLIVISVWISRYIIRESRTQRLRAQVVKIDAREKAGEQISPEQRKMQQKWAEMRESREARRDPADIQADIDKYSTLGYWAFFRESASWSVRRQSRILYVAGVFSAGSMMLLGMAFMKMGIYSATRSLRFYLILLLVGYGAGLTYRVCYLNYNLANYGFDHYYDSWASVIYSYPVLFLSHVPIALGHVGALTLVLKSGKAPWLTSSCAAAGRMALTNYILQSIIITLLFNGYGFGLFGKIDRYHVIYIVSIVWAMQLGGSYWWLKRFRFGPLEWLWRSLTYWKRQPMLAKSDRGQDSVVEPVVVQTDAL